jgi:hypothetical protein
MKSFRVSIVRWLGTKTPTSQNVLAAGSPHAQNMPGVVDFHTAARYQHMNSRTSGCGVGATQQDPVRIVDSATKLPSSLNAIPAIHRDGDTLPGKRAGDQVILSITKDFVLHGLRERSNTSMVSHCRSSIIFRSRVRKRLFRGSRGCCMRSIRRQFREPDLPLGKKRFLK